MAVSSRPISTSSTDPESLILQGKDVRSKKEKKSTQLKSEPKKPKKSKASQKYKHASSPRARRPYATLFILSTLLLALASAAGIVFAVLATAVLHLQVPGDVPSRIAIFGASIISVGFTVVQAFALCSRSNSLLSICLLINRLVLLAWIAAVVLTSLAVAKTVKDATISSTLAAQAVYLNLLLSGVGFIATGVLSFCLEMATRRSKQIDQEDDDVDSLLNRSVSQRGSMTSEKTVDTVDVFEAAAETEPRPKKLLFSYKATTQLMDDTPASRRASMVQAAPVTSTQPAAEPTVHPSTSIKRKPVKSMMQPAPSATGRRKSVMPPAASAMFSDPFADPVESPFSDSNRIESKPTPTVTLTPASRRLSKMPTQSLPKLITSVAPVTAASTFYLDSSGSSNYDNDEDREDKGKGQQLDVNRASMPPYSPAVTRPLSIVPPMPQVPVPKMPTTLMPAPQTAAAPKRKPVGSAPAAAAAPASPIERKPVPSMVATKTTVPKTEPMEPLSPMSQPALPVQTHSVPTAPSSSSSLSSPTTQLSMHFASAVSSRKSSNASEMSESDASMFSMSLSYSTPSLADMVASSLRRVSVVDAKVSTVVSKAFVGATPLPTRFVAYAQPRVLDQPIVRKSFIATTNGGSSGSEANSRRPSEVSIMETIYSPAEEESEQNERSEDKNNKDEEDDELAAMVRQEAEAAAAAADAGRRWLEPSRESMRDPPPPSQRVERTLSVSKHLSKKPYLSPVEEKEQETSDEETSDEETEESVESDDDGDDGSSEENPSVHTIVVHEPVGFTATGLSRTASRMRKAALQAAATKVQTVSSTSTSTSTSTSAYIPAYTRRRLSAANNYNFSRPMRADSVSGSARINNRASIMSTMSMSSAKRASLVVPAVPQTSLLVSPRSRVRRQLLQMLPMQHRPAAVAVSRSMKPVKPVKVTTPRKGRQSLSGRRRRRSLSLNLVTTVSDSDSELSSSLSSSSRSSSTSSSSPSRRSTSLAKTATRARRRNHARGGHLAGLRSSTLLPSSSSAYKRMSAGSIGSRSPYTPYTPHNRPISPMTVLMERR